MAAKPDLGHWQPSPRRVGRALTPQHRLCPTMQRMVCAEWVSGSSPESVWFSSQLKFPANSFVSGFTKG